MPDETVDTWSHLLDFSEKTRVRLHDYKNKYPILHDYFKLKENELAESDQAYRMSGPNVRAKKAANLSELSYSVMTSLDAMDDEGFSFLYDETLWPMLRTAILENKLPINHRWAKSLIAANILELVINDMIKKLDPSKYAELKKDSRAGLDKRFEELNSILISKKLDKFKLNTIKFQSLKAIRNLADHPDPDVLKEIEDKHVNETIDYALAALNQLRQALNEIETKT